MATLKPNRRAATPKPVVGEPPKQFSHDNQFAVAAGVNLPNHSKTMAGRGRFLAIRNTTGNGIVLRTRTEALRLAGWLLVLADIHNLPWEDDTEVSLEEMIEAIRRT